MHTTNTSRTLYITDTKNSVGIVEKHQDRYKFREDQKVTVMEMIAGPPNHHLKKDHITISDPTTKGTNFEMLTRPGSNWFNCCV